MKILFLLCLILIAVQPVRGQVEEAHTIFSIDVRDNGTAHWSIEHRLILETEQDVELFQSYVETFEDQKQAYLEEFSSETTELVEKAETVTGRSMSATNFDMSLRITQTESVNYGVIEYEFDWIGFAKLEGDRILMGDVFEGGFYLYQDDILIISYPPGYFVHSASPSPYSTIASERKLVWYGRSNFDSGEPNVVFAYIGGFTIATSPSSLTIDIGGTKTSEIAITPLHSFDSTVSLTISGLPSGVSASIDPQTVVPVAGESVTSTLTVTVNSTAAPDTYTLTITGTGGELSHSTFIVLTIPEVAPSTCFIATATYGSDLSPEVQFLRGFRDHTITATFAGSQFMTVFHQFYYSFSPYIAHSIAGSPEIRAAANLMLYPLIGILHISAIVNPIFHFNPEFAVIMTGLIASSLIGVVYFSPWAIASALIFRRLRKSYLRVSRLKLPLSLWLVSLVGIAVGEMLFSPVVMKLSTAVFVLTTIALSSLLITVALAHAVKGLYTVLIIGQH